MSKNKNAKPPKESTELLYAICGKIWTITTIVKPTAYDENDEFDFTGLVEEPETENQHCNLTAGSHNKGVGNGRPKRKLRLLPGYKTIRVNKNKIEMYVLFEDHHQHLTHFVFKGNDKVGYRFKFKVIGLPGSHEHAEEGHLHQEGTFVTHNDSGGGTGT